jgi:hypothetical protein
MSHNAKKSPSLTNFPNVFISPSVDGVVFTVYCRDELAIGGVVVANITAEPILVGRGDGCRLNEVDWKMRHR